MKKTIKTNLNLLPILYQITMPIKRETIEKDSPRSKSIKMEMYNSDLTYAFKPNKPVSKPFIDNDLF